METERGEAVCQFCVGGSPPFFDLDDPYASDDDVSAVLLQYSENPSKLGEHEHERPAQIQIAEEDVNDTLKTLTFVRDIVDVAKKKFSRESAEYYTLEALENNLNMFSEMVAEKARRFDILRKHGQRPAPILFSLAESKSLYGILDVAEKVYGKFVRDWFLTKSKKDWPEWRKIFYEGAWNLGSFVRHGRPAKTPSDWLLGKRKPIGDDPLAKYPIGKEPKWSPGSW